MTNDERGNGVFQRKPGQHFYHPGLPYLLLVGRHYRLTPPFVIRNSSFVIVLRDQFRAFILFRQLLLHLRRYRRVFSKDGFDLGFALRYVPEGGV